VAKPTGPSRTQRSRAASPTRRTAGGGTEQAGRQTALTARAAILVLAVASVIVAVALPFKIWLGQRGDISDLSAQTRRAEARIAQLNAQDRRWHDPGYVETQARQRLHLMVPGQKTYVVLGRGHGTKAAAKQRQATVASGSWYSQFWQSDKAAGSLTTHK
jgi:cell division protein FtsB